MIVVLLVLSPSSSTVCLKESLDVVVVGCRFAVSAAPDETVRPSPVQGKSNHTHEVRVIVFLGAAVAAASAADDELITNTLWARHNYHHIIGWGMPQGSTDAPI